MHPLDRGARECFAVLEHYLRDQRASPGVDVERFSPGGPRVEVLERFGLRASEVYVLYVGRITEKKGVIDLVRAWREVVRAVDARLLFVGGGELKFLERGDSESYLGGYGLRLACGCDSGGRCPRGR